MVESEFDKACQRCDEAMNKEQAYLDLIEKNGEELRTMEDRDNDAAEREFETEEKLRFVICLFIGAVSHFTHILLLYFLAILRISCRFSLIKAHKLHYFTFFRMQEQQMCGEITAIPTVTSRLDFCILHALNTLYTK